MPDIVLTTLNAKYIHASFGLRYLRANLGELRDNSIIAEFEIKQRPIEIAEKILSLNPKIVGIGVYIWNAVQSAELVSLLKRIRPDLLLVLGGPEVSYEWANQPIVQLADYVITGEADQAFATLCRDVLSGKRPETKVIAAALPVPDQLALPYSEYDASDIRNRVIYVEASRGCPFTCEFCLSSLDVPVRQFAAGPFLESMQQLLDRGVTQFKFVDRTFNLNLNVSGAILRFFLERYRPGLFVHFEMVPDRLPDALREIIRQFPPGALQFEVGIQTFNPEVAKLISRRQNYDRLADNLTFLKQETGVHVHADLIFGLPGEDLESFGTGFDRLVAIGPQEIQVGILKRLRGTPIVRHDAEWQMVYAEHPPYEILSTRLVPFETMQRMRRFARYWDLIANSGNFREAVTLLWTEASPFHSFLAFSDWLFLKLQRTSTISLDTLASSLAEYLSQQASVTQVHETLRTDYARAGRSELPTWLRPVEHTPRRDRSRSTQLPKRQSRFTQNTTAAA